MEAINGFIALNGFLCFLWCILDIPRLKPTRISLTYMFCMGVISDR